MQCPHCSTNQLEGSNYCRFCGTPLASPSASPPTAAPAADPFDAPPAETLAPTRYSLAGSSVGTIGAFMAILGSLMPWVTIGNISFSGLAFRVNVVLLSK